MMPALNLALALIFNILTFAVVVAGFGLIQWPPAPYLGFCLPLIPALFSFWFSIKSLKAFRGNVSRANRYFSFFVVVVAVFNLGFATMLPIANYRAMEATQKNIKERLEISKQESLQQTSP